MPCIDLCEPLPRRWRREVVAAAAAGVALLAGCGSRTTAPPAPPAPVAVPAPPSQPTPAPEAGRPTLAPPVAARSWDEFKHRAALRLMAANPGRVYEGPVPDPLLAIPVLEVELEADGRVRRINVLRYPRQAKDTTQLAIDAVKRAAPFGPVSHLPRPWKFAEVFLFDDDRRFKPRTLDE